MEADDRSNFYKIIEPVPNKVKWVLKLPDLRSSVPILREADTDTILLTLNIFHTFF